jgi:hypothetical protein
MGRLVGYATQTTARTKRLKKQRCLGSCANASASANARCCVLCSEQVPELVVLQRSEGTDGYDEPWENALSYPTEERSDRD